MAAPKGNKYGKNGGAPTKYKAEYADIAYKLTLLGHTDVEMAEVFNVSEVTINNWKKDHKEFFKSITRGKDQADGEVARKLWERANGYSHKEAKVFHNNGEVIEHEVTKHYPPDTEAMKFWLYNRQRGKWKNRRSDEVTGEDGGPIKTEATVKLNNLTKDELKVLKKILPDE